MGQKALWIAGCLLAVLAVTLWLAFHRPAKDPQPVIHWSAYDRIKVGMTREQVEALLGGPPGDYTDPARDIETIYDIWLNDERYQDEVWWTDGWALCVRFDRDGLVAEKLEVGGVSWGREPKPLWRRLLPW